MMTIPQSVADGLLARCHRHCCICHRFCCSRMEIHHIDRNRDNDDPCNLIPLCFDCHAEAGHYYVQHPKGRKFGQRELGAHRDQWFAICERQPGALLSGAVSADAGPLQGLVAELEFNAVIARMPGPESGYPCPIGTRQFERVISEGSMLILPEKLWRDLAELYAKLSQYNVQVRAFENKSRGVEHRVASTLLRNIRDSGGIEEVLGQLRSQLLGDRHSQVEATENSRA